MILKSTDKDQKKLPKQTVMFISDFIYLTSIVIKGKKNIAWIKGNITHSLKTKKYPLNLLGGKMRSYNRV